VQLLRGQANRLTSLTRGLRRLADLETRPLEVESFDVRELLHEVVELLQAGGRIQLDVQQVPWPLPPLQADRELLLVALRNVVDNALQYSGEAVRVRAWQASGDLAIEVVDTGIGIPPDDLPHITEELYRGANVGEVVGSGLGLAMARRIVERHAGRLDVRSRSHQGTIVTVYLPYERTPAS
jgi:two-component system OmpR family sensor kinase